MSGHSNERALLVGLVGSRRSVLDCGCSTGDIARRLSANGCVVVGIEAAPDRAEAAAAVCRDVIVGDLDHEAVFDLVRRRHGPFDCIVCSHVLEHLRDPEIALGRLASLLIPGGRLIVGLPNVAHWRMRLALARGRWDYTDDGVLDRTHLRFFTLASAMALLSAAPFQIDEVIAPDFFGPTPLHDGIRRALRTVTTPGLFASSFLFSCSGRRATP